MNTAFELRKMTVAIARNGRQFVFTHRGVNTHGEDDGTTVTYTVNGLFHETTQHVLLVQTEGSTVKQKPTPSILCLLSDTTSLVQGDEATIGGKLHKITDIKDIENAGIIADISLGVVI